MLAELGYGFAYRVLDAQYFGVAQRRRRVFVVGCLGNWRAAAAVLFERDSLCGNPAPSRTQRERAPTFFESSLAQYRQDNVGGTLKASGGVLGGGSETFVRYPKDIPEVMSTLLSSTAGVSRTGNAATEHETYIPMSFRKSKRAQTSDDDESWVQDEVTNTINLFDQGDVRTTQAILQPIPIDTMNHIGRKDNHSFGDFEPGAPSYTLTKGHSHAVAQPIAYSIAPGAGASKEDIYVTPTDTARTLDASVNNIGNHQGGTAVMQSMAVRRLTPVECERLQGFPDGYTNIRENCPDGPRYKALGNSMAVPVMRWIGQRIQAVEEI
jgi:DNA (cytosine-5)-methyltransferase 1